jgi:asparagine synthase (glutamine-hydrolysing)
MCGICGIGTRGEAPDRETVERMNRTIVHRGPDGEGVHVAPGVALAMRRLAIIDLVTGDQPMPNEDGAIQVVFNGEIYNHQELRRELEAKGHRFRSRSDTEVIPHLYETYGLGFAERLNGIFGIALWDARERRLLLARDRVGVKPLFYAVRDGTLYFGSEVKCLLAAGASRRELNLAALDRFLTFEYTAGTETLFADVHKLPPGHLLIWQHGQLRTEAYWRLAPGTEEQLDEAEWAARLRATLDEAVRRQMVSDVPLGAFLSGGVDSSVIVSAMSRASAQPVRTFSIGFTNQTYNELPFAALMARLCRTQHHERILAPEYLGMVDEVIEHLDQPIADFSVFPTLLVSRVAREKVTVVLSGDGGDELFAGYDAYVADRAAHRALDRLPRAFRHAVSLAGAALPETRAKKGLLNSVRRFLEGAAFPPEWEHMRWMTFLSPNGRRALYRGELLRAAGDGAAATINRYLANAGGDRLQRQLFCDLQFYLPEDILVKVDHMGMAASIENRVPFLDNEVVELVARMPSALKWKGRTRKHILKRAYADVLPPEILSREKQGFSIPLKSWLNEEWNELLHDVLSESALRRDGLFEPATVQRWIQEHESGRANHSHILWGLMVFQLWKRRWLDQAPSAAAAPLPTVEVA